MVVDHDPFYRSIQFLYDDLPCSQRRIDGFVKFQAVCFFLRGSLIAMQAY